MLPIVNNGSPAFDISKKIPEISAQIRLVLSKIIVSWSRFILPPGPAEEFDD
jgi:hypothetical protein